MGFFFYRGLDRFLFVVLASKAPLRKEFDELIGKSFNRLARLSQSIKIDAGGRAILNTSHLKSV